MLTRFRHPVHLAAATLLRVSAEGLGTVLVLIVQARTGHAATAGFLQTAAMFPYVLSGPLMGDVLDRAARPRTVTVALAGCYVAAAGLLLTTAGRVPLGIAMLAALVVGCVEPMVVALTSVLPRLVPADRLTRAYGLEAASYNVAAIAGPGLAAVLAAWRDAETAAAAIVGSAVLGALALPLLAIPGPMAKPLATDSGRGRRMGGVLFGGLTGGLAELWRNRVLRSLTIATTLAFVGVGGVAVTAVLFAEHIGERPSAGGRLLAAFAVGALIGSLASARWLKARYAEWVMPAGMVAFGVTLGLVALSPSLLWAMGCFVLAGIFDGPVFAATLVLRQREAPAEHLGQINTTGGSLKIGAAAMGAALTGALADTLGPVGLLWSMAAFQFAGAAIGLALLTWRRSG